MPVGAQRLFREPPVSGQDRLIVCGHRPDRTIWVVYRYTTLTYRGTDCEYTYRCKL